MKRCKWLDCKHVVFGQVEDGWDVVKAIEKVGSDGLGTTSERVVIADCGELKTYKKPKKVIDGDYYNEWGTDYIDIQQAKEKQEKADKIKKYREQQAKEKQQETEDKKKK